MKTVIHLEDNGQDFSSLICDDSGKVIDAKPFQAGIWAGSYIPIHDPGMMKVGELCPIHNTHIRFGFLKYRIEKVETIED